MNVLSIGGIIMLDSVDYGKRKSKQLQILYICFFYFILNFQIEILKIKKLIIRNNNRNMADH